MDPTKLTSQKKQSQDYERIKIRCSKCHARMIDRVKTPDGWILHFKQGRWNLYVSAALLTCGHCGSGHHIDAKKGIISAHKSRL